VTVGPIREPLPPQPASINTIETTANRTIFDYYYACGADASRNA
jgi:hypothetical protein